MQKSPNCSLDREKTLSHEQIKEMAEQHLHQLKKVRRDNEKIQKELGTRTISDILASGETFYMGACVDSTLSFLMKLKEHIPAEKLKLGCELLRQNETGNLTFHLFLIDHSRTPQRVIDFVRSNFVSIYEGNYQNPQEGKKITQLGKFSISGEKVEKSDSFLTLADKMGVGLPPELFQAYLSKLQHDNTPENFEHFQKNSPINIKIKRQKESTKSAVLGVVKKFGFLLLSLHLLQACTQKPDLKPETSTPVSSHSSGALQSLPERKDDPNIPNCEPLDLKPINPEEIINIDDVVKNCKYETGHVVYSDIGAGSNFPVTIDLWKGNITIQPRGSNDKREPLCEYREKTYYPLKKNESAIINFIKKYKIQENPYFNSINLHGELDERSVHRYFNCKESRLCKKLVDISYGANERHHFFRVDQQGEYLMVDNKTVYAVGNLVDNKSSNADTNIYIESPRVVSKLQGDTLIVNKYTNGKLLEKYKSNPELIDSDFERTGKHPIIGTFQIKTCEIPL